MDILAIVGSRSTWCEIAIDVRPDAIISGGASGVDTAAKEYAVANGIEMIEVLPDYTAHGRRAPLVRNGKIAAQCTRMIAYWDGASRGTMDVVNKARRLGKMVTVITPTPALKVTK